MKLYKNIDEALDDYVSDNPDKTLAESGCDYAEPYYYGLLDGLELAQALVADGYSLDEASEKLIDRYIHEPNV